MAGTATGQPDQFAELKEIVSKTLEKRGILAKAQAELRKHVFEALIETEGADPKKTNIAPQIDPTDINDKFAMALIRDFLSYHHLDYTLSLMNTETQRKVESTQNVTRNEIASRLGLGAQKPSPDCSLLHILIAKLFDGDIFKPRNSTLDSDIKLKPRVSADLYRSSLEKISFKKELTAIDDDKENDDQKLDTIDNPIFNLPKKKISNELPPINRGRVSEQTEEDVDISILEDDEEENEQIEFNDPLCAADIEIDNLLDSSSNDENAEDEEDQQPDEEEASNQDEEMKRIEVMNKAMEKLRIQTSEFEKLKKESVSPSQSGNISQSQSITEYEDDFGSDEFENNDEPKKDDIIDDILEEEDIDEDDIEIDSASEDNLYCAKEEDEVSDNNQNKNETKKDELITDDFNLEAVSDIIINAKTEKIDFNL